MFSIGPYRITTPSVLAPMAGVADLPFRQLCRRLGAGMAVAEMVTADTRLWSTQKSRYRLPSAREEEPRTVQIVGADPQMLASAACESVRRGAQIIDINMGCPAKKVCRVAAGAALLRDEQLVADILSSVVNAVSVPVTLKIRTGWSPQRRNGVAIARIAEDAGIRALSVHGRTGECRFNGAAEYDSIAQIVESTHLPVIANGDIDSPQKARQVLEYTGAAAVMIGRAALAKPWMFREINQLVTLGERPPPPSSKEMQATFEALVSALHEHFGEALGLRFARKHMSWFLDSYPQGTALRQSFNRLESCAEQRTFFNHRFLSDLEKNNWERAA